jgi:hypothetical protein
MSEHVEPVPSRHPHEIRQYLSDEGDRLVRSRLLWTSIAGDAPDDG